MSLAVSVLLSALESKLLSSAKLEPRVPTLFRHFPTELYMLYFKRKVGIIGFGDNMELHFHVISVSDNSMDSVSIVQNMNEYISTKQRKKEKGRVGVEWAFSNL